MNSYLNRLPSHNQGFGLLEALVALVLISSVGFALLAWVQQNLDTLQRLRGHYEELAARRTVLDWSSSINPMESPEGELDLGGFKLKWEAEREGNVVPQAGYPMGMGAYDIAIFNTHVKTYRHGEFEVWFEEDLTQIGYRKERSFKLPFS